MGGEGGPFVLAAMLDAQLPSAFGSEGGTSADGDDGATPAGADRSDGERRVLVVGTSTPMRD